ACQKFVKKSRMDRVATTLIQIAHAGHNVNRTVAAHSRRSEDRAMLGIEVTPPIRCAVRMQRDEFSRKIADIQGAVGSDDGIRAWCNLPDIDEGNRPNRRDRIYPGKPGVIRSAVRQGPIGMSPPRLSQHNEDD